MIITLSIDEARSMLGATIRTISKDETRTALNALCLDVDDFSVVAVSTDGHRLARFTLKRQAAEGATRVLICRETVVALEKVVRKQKVGDVTIDTEARTIAVRPAGVSFSFPNLGDVQFPPYQQVIPTYDESRSGRTWIGIDANYLADAQAAFKDACGSKGVALEFGDELDPITVRSGSRLHGDLLIVIMPMRVDAPDGASSPKTVKKAA